MTLVLASTDQVPELADVIARRRELGLDTYDEWWEGTYRGDSDVLGLTVADLSDIRWP
jgi:hypothetical protein